MVGSTALDSIKTPHAERRRLLGGSASHASVAASFFAPVSLVGIVGDDFPQAYLNLYRRHGIKLDALQIVPGKTFHWAGKYEANMNNRRTLKTELGVFETFAPDLPDPLRQVSYVLLANIAPSLQHHVLDQIRSPRFIIADTMDLWLNTARSELIRLLRRIDAFVLNDSEVRLLTKDDNLFSAAGKIHRLGPKYVIIKKGEHGAILSGPDGFFLAPAFPIQRVIDPTGAGDTFVGGIIGYLAGCGGPPRDHLRRSILYGTAVASFCCEGFGLDRTTKINRKVIDQRVNQFEKFLNY